MSAAGTPVSTRVSEVQFFPLSFVKYKKPFPDFGMVKEKFTPTPWQPEGPQFSGVFPPLTPWIMILGSLIPSAKAIIELTASKAAIAQI
jgi:hypothetical protein